MYQHVALLAEGVDRNVKSCKVSQEKPQVALLAEGVDRNESKGGVLYSGSSVALLAEGVDRNILISGRVTDAATSPSSRRAWIEIPTRGRPLTS